ncbi:MAG: hypothetical protein IJH80_00795 [Ruminococcus sp.]|nr:hypothetical protein [Ruminococcus sp.]
MRIVKKAIVRPGGNWYLPPAVENTVLHTDSGCRRRRGLEESGESLV